MYGPHPQGHGQKEEGAARTGGPAARARSARHLPASQRVMGPLRSVSWARFAARHGPAPQRATVEHAHVSLRSSFSSGVHKLSPLPSAQHIFQISMSQAANRQTDLEVGDGGIQAIAGILAISRPCLCELTNV